MQSLAQAKAEVVSVAHKLGRREWVANHDGNVSVRLPEGRFVATPSGVHKSEIDHSKLVIVDCDGKAESAQVFSEWELHRAVYAARPDVMAVVHAHPPYATAVAVAGGSLAVPVMAEPVVSLGNGILSVPFFPPKSSEGLALLSAAATRADVWLLENHGVLSAGPSLDHAYLRLELVEHQAKIQTLARAWGGARALPPQTVDALLAARKAAGLMAPQEGTVTTPSSLEDIVARMVAEELRASRQ